MQLFWTIAKTALLTSVGVIGMMAIIDLLTAIPFPASIDFSAVSLYVNKVYTIFVHWIPGFQILWPIGVAIVRTIVSYWLFRASFIAIRFVFKILGD